MQVSISKPKIAIVVVSCFSETVLADFEVLLGYNAAYDVTDLDSYTLCHHFTGATEAGATMSINCDVRQQARYVAIVKRASDVKLHFCEISVLSTIGT